MIHNQGLQIGMFGTFDVENYGDLLFPLIAEAELSQRLGPTRLHRFSYYRKTPLDWPYEVTPLSELPSLIGNLDGVIIGGGCILRFDKWVAENYRPPKSAVQHPTDYWLTPALLALNNGLPVVWNAPGVHGPVPVWAESLMKLTVGGNSYVSVRDSPSRQALQPFAANNAVKVVPDTAFGVARLLDQGGPSSEYVRLRRDVGLSDPYIVVQATGDLLPFARFVRSHPQLFKTYRFLLLPTGPVHGDDNAVLSSTLPGAIQLPFWPKPVLLAELIGRGAAVVAVSLHVSISALAFDVPLFRPAPLFEGKYAILEGLGRVFPLNDEGEMKPAQFASISLESKPSDAMSHVLHQLEDHWDAVASILGAAKRRSPAGNETNGFWQTLPRFLEASANAIGALNARDEEIAALHNSTSWKVTAPMRSLVNLWRR